MRVIDADPPSVANQRQPFVLRNNRVSIRDSRFPTHPKVVMRDPLTIWNRTKRVAVKFL